MLKLKTMAGRASLLLRTVSKSIDIILCLSAAEALPKAGWLAGIGYILISDGLMGGRSAGKKLTGLMVITQDGSGCTVKESILRNLTIVAGLFLWKVPYVGWLLLAGACGFEFLVVLGSKDGRRIGDEIAKTMVVEITVDTKET